MKLVDVNVLIYAVDASAPHHQTARRWLDAALNGSETIGLPTAVLNGFLRIMTNPRVFASPLDVENAVELIERWRGRPQVTVPRPTDRHYPIVAELLAATGAGGNLASDAHLAALAIEHGADIVSYDNDFSRFPGLNWVSPATI